MNPIEYEEHEGEINVRCTICGWSQKQVLIGRPYLRTKDRLAAEAIRHLREEHA